MFTNVRKTYLFTGLSRTDRCCDPFSTQCSQTANRKLTDSCKDQLAKNGIYINDDNSFVCNSCKFKISFGSSSSTAKETAEATTSMALIGTGECQQQFVDDINSESAPVCLQIENLDTSNNTSSQNPSDKLDDDLYTSEVNNLSVIEKMNEVMVSIGSSIKFDRHCLQSIKAKSTAFHLFSQELASHFFDIPAREECNFCNCEILANLKTAVSTSNTADMIRLLALIPKTVPSTTVMKELNLGRKFVEHARNRAVQQTEFSTLPERKVGHKIDPNTEQAVIDYFYLDEFSRVMPGLNDCKSVVVNGKRELKQKRLLLNTVNEIYESFKAAHPNMKIGLTKFFLLKPKECISANNHGTHNICVCKYHSNAKLKAAVFDRQTSTIRHHLAALSCNPPSLDCLMDECSSCMLNHETLQEKLIEELETDGFETVTYWNWVSTERASLKSIVEDIYEFVDTYVDELKYLKVHDFITKMQQSSFYQIKMQLRIGEFLILLDFSENYGHLIQDSIQSFYYTKKQSTVHPALIYYRSDDGKIDHISCIFISENLNHDVIFVHCVQTKLIEFLKKRFSVVNYIHYFTDGSAGQYKNLKSFSNLYYHEADHGVKATHHFHATSHGRNAVDGIGGTFKRLACHESLRRVGKDPIADINQLFDFSQEKIKNMTTFLITEEDLNNAQAILAPRFEKAKTIEGTQKLHCFYKHATKQNILCAKRYTSDDKVLEFKIIDTKSHKKQK